MHVEPHTRQRSVPGQLCRDLRRLRLEAAAGGGARDTSLRANRQSGAFLLDVPGNNVVSIA